MNNDANGLASNIRRMTLEDSQSGFASGEQSLDSFFAKHAHSNSRRGLGITYVLPSGDSGPSDLPEILGFYTISMATIESGQAAQVMKNLPRYPIPAALIGRLAVDRRAQGLGLGRTLLVDALNRALSAGDAIGCAGVVVDAKNAIAEAFYAKYGFVTVESVAWPHRMFIAMATVRQATT
jgi:GNAT superfamily N-acetyltransferase